MPGPTQQPALGVPIFNSEESPILRQGTLFPNAQGFISSTQIYASFMRSGPTTQSLNGIKRTYQLATESQLPSNETALRRAAFKGNVDHIEALILEYDTAVDARGSNGFTALDWAYHENQMDALDALCWLKADQSLLKSLLEKYTLDTEAEWPIKQVALVRSIEAHRLDDVRCLVERYHAEVTPQLCAHAVAGSDIENWLSRRLTSNAVQPS